MLRTIAAPVMKLESRAALIEKRASSLGLLKNRMDASDWHGCVRAALELIDYDLRLKHRVHAKEVDPVNNEREWMAHPV